MSQRLDNLKRQKQLIEEHLRWIDAEIVAETGVSWESKEEKHTHKPGSLEPFPTSRPEAKPSESSQPPVAAAYSQNPEEDQNLDELSDQLITQYGHASTRPEMDPRLSLILFFGGLLGFIGLVIFLFYWFGYR